VPDEILADFTGDARADPRFLTTLARENPSKFRRSTETVGNWILFVALELSKACFLLWTMQVHLDTFSREVHKHDREGFPCFVGFR
jgi:hypothetical protein